MTTKKKNEKMYRETRAMILTAEKDGKITDVERKKAVEQLFNECYNQKLASIFDTELQSIIDKISN